MQAKKNVIIEPNVTIPLPEGVTWAELITNINEEKNQQFLKKISPATFKFILEESNRSKIIKSLLRTLKQTDPQNATREYADKILEAMREVARMFLKRLDKSKFTIDTYNKIAGIYTNKYFEDLIDTPFIDRFLSLLPKKAKILDIGCGPGNFTKYIMEKGYFVDGIDLSEEMLKLAKQKVSEGNFQIMDMQDLKFQDESFDGLLAAYSLIHIPSEGIIKTLQGFYKILKTNGLVLIIAQAGEADRIVDEPLLKGEKIFINFFTRNRLSKFLNEAGFKIIFQKEKQTDEIESLSNRVIYTIARKIK